MVDSIIEPADFHQSLWLTINNEGGSLQIACFNIKQKHVASILTRENIKHVDSIVGIESFAAET